MFYLKVLFFIDFFYFTAWKRFLPIFSSFSLFHLLLVAKWRLQYDGEEERKEESL